MKISYFSNIINKGVPGSVFQQEFSGGPVEPFI